MVGIRSHFLALKNNLLFAAGSLTDPGEWVLAERWRGVERPLPPDVPVLHVLAAWGDARHEVRLKTIRYRGVYCQGKQQFFFMR